MTTKKVTPALLDLTPSQEWRDWLTVNGVEVTLGHEYTVRDRLATRSEVTTLRLAYMPRRSLHLAALPEDATDEDLDTLLSAISSVINEAGGCRDRGEDDAVLLGALGSVPWLLHLCRGELHGAGWGPAWVRQDRCVHNTAVQQWGQQQPLATDSGTVWTKAAEVRAGFRGRRPGHRPTAGSAGSWPPVSCAQPEPAPVTSLVAGVPFAPVATPAAPVAATPAAPVARTPRRKEEWSQEPSFAQYQGEWVVRVPACEAHRYSHRTVDVRQRDGHYRAVRTYGVMHEAGEWAYIDKN